MVFWEGVSGCTVSHSGLAGLKPAGLERLCGGHRVNETFITIFTEGGGLRVKKGMAKSVSVLIDLTGGDLPSISKT